jgi:hypothetical protein
MLLNTDLFEVWTQEALKILLPVPSFPTLQEKKLARYPLQNRSP